MSIAARTKQTALSTKWAGLYANHVTPIIKVKDHCQYVSIRFSLIQDSKCC